MKLMQPIVQTSIPIGDEWIYEVKYDGFRCVLHWEEQKVRLVSRKNVDLTDKFPEIIRFCREKQAQITNFLPLKLDGELVIVNHSFQTNFSAIQIRGRLNKKQTIQQASLQRPASFLAFDMLQQRSEDLTNNPLHLRKKQLEAFFKKGNLNCKISNRNPLGFVHSHSIPEVLWNDVFNGKGEGIIAKKNDSYYSAGKHHNDWFKIKNWRKINGILDFYDTNNEYFTVNVYENDQLIEIGKCKHGVNSKELETLHELFASQGEKQASGYKLPPAICAEINTLDFVKHELREPSINQLLVNVNAMECTNEKMRVDMAMIPREVEPSKVGKVFWPKVNVTKGDLLVYMREISPYMLPYLKDRILTVIRCPDGVNEEFFFQKHLPDYAPSFIRTYPVNDENFFICDKLESLLWFANHGALEYHTPFQTIKSEKPNEIVFDLDPPDRKRFPLAIQAATILKGLLDDLNLVSFVKTSGSKGLQVHIPIPADSLSYEETGVFTQAIAWTIEQEYPTFFTTERMKKNRKERLYLDYVQHGKDKTIVTPYSPRKNEFATVSTPLFWDEVTEELEPEMFTVNNVVKRVQLNGCPFADYFEIGEQQKMDKLFQLLQ